MKKKSKAIVNGAADSRTKTIMAGRKLENIVDQSLHIMQNQQWRVLDISWTEHGEVFVRRALIDRQQEPRDHSQERDA